MPQLVILAGGKGTRLAERLRGPDGSLLPKPLVPVGGVPLLARQLEHAARFGIDRVVILVNHRAEAIAEFCRDAAPASLAIELVDDGTPRGTAGAVLAALDKLEDTFCVMYGDTLLNVDLERFAAFHQQKGADISVFVHPNNHPADSDLFEADEHDVIRALHPYPHPEGTDFSNLVNAALYFVQKSALLESLDLPQPLDFAKDLFPRMLSHGKKLAAYRSPEYIKDIGTPERLAQAENDLLSGRFAAQNLRQPQRAVFLDRDGVVNEERGYISSPDQLALIPGAAQAIQRLNQAGLLTVLVTNQPVIARGECDEHTMQAIHNRLETLLGREKAYLDRIYYCPHHPDKGFAGERPELKGPCVCRKPGTGMIEQAERDLNINRAQSWLIGDRSSDIQCAANAGIRSILVQTGAGGQDKQYPAVADFITKNITEAVELLCAADNAPRSA